MKHLLTFLLVTITSTALWATHNRAGEIHIEQIGPLTIRATIITWTKTSSVNADRDTLNICWGDGTPCEPVLRSNGGGSGVPLANDIKYNTYVAIHTFAGPATYRISMTDPNRVGGIINVNPPASDNVPFHIETIYTFQDQQFGGSNTTPYLLQQPIDTACVGRVFKHSPNAYDKDGDSLSYKFIVPLFAVGGQVPNYTFPNQVGGGNNSLSINVHTGEIIWNSPAVEGDYNLAFIVISWRNGVPIDTTIRDMQIFVEKCNNNPPVVTSKSKVCVIAGDTLRLDVSATDPDNGQLVRLSAIGGPLTSVVSKATFTAPATAQTPPVNGFFEWPTVCEHISNQPYSVVFKAVDSLSKPQLADLKILEIEVIGPAPTGLDATSGQGFIELSWDNPYACEDAADNYFLAFSVWRRESSNPFIPDTCETGLAGRGYTRIVFATKQVQNGRYYFKDNNVNQGITYCYRIVAMFARRSAGGYPYNIVEGQPSAEACAQLPRSLPIITNVSVESTDPTNGQMEIRWSKPLASDLDTVINFGPYRYQLLRGNGFSGGALTAVPGASFVANQFWQANDTIFRFDTGLNTTSQPYHYAVAFYVKGDQTPLGNTNTASSVFLNVNSTDQTNLLSWEHKVPWNNYRYDVYRKNDLTGQFDSIGSSDTRAYADRGLVNGKEYCYLVKSVGTYSVGGLANPLINWSQEDCGVPIDTIPPCPPMLTVTNLCDQPDADVDGPPFVNQLSWTNPNVTCTGTDDVVQYRIWSASAEGQPLTPFKTVEGATALQEAISGPELAGCFAVSALDSVGNESALSNIVCKDNCPRYELPNTFTPNGDDANETFRPFPGYRFVESIDLQVFNRWGNLVFSTTNPEINWTGENQQGNALAEGTYFYVCRVYERRVTGTVLRPDVFSGYIELIRSGN
ncbi:MAG: gliding motility-associated C-terminal domain-containing protein [Saprospiraceae bacterium]|nr:gliding motility-associated C-terminal domain-containing protein [Saprospiraceae bacterium]